VIRRRSWAALLQRALTGLVDLCRRFAVWVVLAGTVLAGASGFYAAHHLEIDTDTDNMFAATLPWRQHEMALDRAFPQFQGLLVAVISADVPEQADATAQALAQALASDHTHFSMVRRPDASPYLRREGLLLLSTAQLTDLLNRTIDAQPFLGKLAADPTARGLFSALSLLGLGVTHDDADLTPYLGQLRAFHAAMAAALSFHPQPLSWQRLLSGKLGDLGGQYKFVLVKPRLDFSSLEPGGAATQALRAAAAQLEFVRSGAAQVRVTGPVALADTQFATVAQGAVAGLIGSVMLITVWLILAVRSWRLIVPILGTLGLGLMLTLLFASAAIGVLNLVSVGFGVLFVGIAVDFAIQFSVRYREARHSLGDSAAAAADCAARRRRDPGRGAGDGGGISRLRANRFQRRRGTWSDRRRRHADCVSVHGHRPAGRDHPVPASHRASRDRLCLGWAAGWSADALAWCDPVRVRRLDCAVTRARPPAAIRFRSAGHAKPQYRGDADAARPDERSADQSIQH